jgi:ribonucleoside-diphosphate reductase alpha chain
MSIADNAVGKDTKKELRTKLPTPYQNFIHKSRYARWSEELGRRENWDETVDRYIDFMCDAQCDGLVPGDIKKQLRDAIVGLDVMPSMRALMTAGKALQRDHVAGYNCAYVAIDDVRAFDEILYILMCGTGVGYSVEGIFVNQLPSIAEEFHETDTTIVVRDSKIGWAAGFRELVSLLYAGLIPSWDLSRVRPAGARLKIFGGRSSGPAPLNDLFNFAVNIFREASGRKLRPIEASDLVCKIAEIVVVGGVRRSALISLGDLEDRDMRAAKQGAWSVTHGHRRLANISAVYDGRPPLHTFMKEWTALYSSFSGERGIFNRRAARLQCEKTGRREVEGHAFGTNPCSEILLRSCEFCNLTEVVIRLGDSFEEIERKVRLATILGTIQATLVDFRYLRKKWRRNCEDERLLGVSLTGIMDHEVLRSVSGTFEHNGVIYTLEQALEHFKQVAVDTNKEWSAKFSIKAAAAITCVKPSGTVSQLVNSASGIHERWNSFYIRNVRADNKDPLTFMMKDVGIPHEPAAEAPSHMTVFSFPVESDNGSSRHNRNAIDQLNHWLVYQRYWCEHKPSITVYIGKDEWFKVADWIWEHFDEVSGIAFLPKDESEHRYTQLPYQDCEREDLEILKSKMPHSINWELLSRYEKQDMTRGTQTLACSGNSCEIVDLV